MQSLQRELRERHLTSQVAQAPKTHWSVAALKERGWTDAMVRHLLREPDKLSPNPFYRSGAPVKLFAIKRVEAAEATEEFEHMRSKAEVRSARAVDAAEVRAATTVSNAKDLEVSVERVSVDELKSMAKSNYEARKPYTTTPGFEDVEFWNRIMVNFIRHNLSDYDVQLNRLAGKVGRHQADKIVRLKVFQKMKVVYPELDYEIERQLRRRYLDL